MNSISPNRAFVAFISYSHSSPDGEWAEWLHRGIERYRLPRPLRKARGGRARVGRVFQDVKELSASPGLSKELRDALDASEFLIVVCSPRSRASQWVNQEVEYFVSTGRRDRIILFLIEGRPADSFPTRLMDDEPLAASVTGSPWQVGRRDRRDALLRLIAPLAGCRFDDLRRRDAERARHVWTAAGAAGLALGVAMSILAGWAVMERSRAVHRFNQVRALSSSLIFDIDNAITDLPGSLPARRLIVSKGLEYLNELSLSARGDAGLLHDLAIGYCAIGDIQGLSLTSNIGDSAGALESYVKSESLLRQALDLRPDDRLYRRRLATLLEHKADVIFDTGRTEDATREYAASQALRAELVRTATKDRAQALLDLASSQERDGNVARAAMNNDGAIAAFRQAQETRLAAMDEADAKPSDRVDLAIGYLKLGLVYRDADRFQEAREAYNASLEQGQRVLDSDPTNGQAFRHKGVVLQHLGTLARKEGKFAEAREFYGESLKVARARRDMDPRDVDAFVGMAQATRQIGDIDFDEKKFDAAEKMYAESAEQLREATRRNPVSEDYRRSLLVGLQYLGDAQRELGKNSAAVESQRQSLRLAEELAGGDNPDISARFDVASCRSMLADALVARSKDALASDEQVACLREAAVCYQKCLEILGDIDKEAPGNTTIRVGIQENGERLAQVRETLPAASSEAR